MTTRIDAPGTGPHITAHKPGKRFKNAARHAHVDGSRKPGQSLKDFARNCPPSFKKDASAWLKAKGSRP